MMIVKIKKDDERFNLKAGDVFDAKRTPYDSSKLFLIRRHEDDYDPECSVYKKDVEAL